MPKSRPPRSKKKSKQQPGETEIFQFDPEMLDDKAPVTIPLTMSPEPRPKPVEEKAQPTKPRHRIPSWRFWVAMLLQLGLILPVPLRNAYVAVAGQTIILDTAAVDPYDIFRGYSQTLSYAISDSDTFEALPGYEIVQAIENELEPERERSQPFYVLLEAPQNPSDLSEAQSPESWQPVGIVRDRPQNLPANQVALRATDNGNAILYNLERYYMPEAQRKELNRTVQELQRSEIGEVKVEVKVDRYGKAIPVSLWLGDQRHQF